MSVTPRLYLELTEPFAVHEHGFVNGNPYILKHAIERRLYTAAPGWSLSPPALLNRESRLIVLTATLTIEGQAHGALGTGIVRSADDGTDKYVQALATAYKTAASDLLPRCALLFGVGWYLKTMNKEQKSKASTAEGLSGYLQQIRGAWEKAGGNLEKLTATGEQKQDKRVT